MAKKRPERQPRAELADRGGKLPRSVFPGGTGTVPRARSFGPVAPSPLWAFRIVDLGGPWCWSAMDERATREVLGRLRSFESMTWAEIDGPTGSHGVALGSLSPTARRRLVQIGQDDAEELFSLRITGRERVWGVRHDHVLRILWWDPRHEVCPSPKKHT